MKSIMTEYSFRIDYSNMLELEKEIQQYSSEEFAIYFRVGAMKKMHQKKCYEQCYGLPFMTHIDAKGNVWPCVAHIGVKEFCYGNIYEQTFDQIWEGSVRKGAIRKLNEMNIDEICREACRLDEMNRYLDELKHPGEHVNFI